MDATISGWLAPYPLMSAACCLQIGMAALALLAMLFDRRELLGSNIWIKPLKFDISICIMVVTAAAFLSGLQSSAPARTLAGNSVAIALSLEGILISVQALRGVRSHMNYSTAIDAGVSMGMGFLAVIATLGYLAILGLTFVVQPRWPTAVTLGVRLGLLVFLAGSYEGTLMFRRGGHTVGASDGGQGVPFLHWSRKHGDLRIAHFFALHALQAFPIIGYLCSHGRLSESAQVTVVVLLIIAYTAGVWILFRLALQGRPLAFS